MKRKLICIESDFQEKPRRYEFDDINDLAITIQKFQQKGLFFAFLTEDLNSIRYFLREFTLFSQVPVLVKTKSLEDVDYIFTGVIPNPIFLFNQDFYERLEEGDFCRIHNKIWGELHHKKYHALNYTLKSTMDAIEIAVDYLQQFTFSIFPDMKNHRFFEYNLIIRELLTNAVKHGNRFDINKTVKLTVYTDPLEGYFGFAVLDEGEGFDYNTRLKEVREDELRVNQRGLFLINEFSHLVISDKNLIITEFNKI